ncbi:hypothetical protein Hanom_Chr04g00377621 [Helianthus anomalus]
MFPLTQVDFVRRRNSRTRQRIADRGSGRVGVDPRDIKIRILRQRVRDLELKHEIQRLKQWIHDLEALSTWDETKPEEFVGDKLSGDEEHPTNGDAIYDSPPMYDEYGDEDWYSWVTGGDLPGDEWGFKIHNVEGDTTVDNGGDVVASGVVEMVKDCDWVANGGVISTMEDRRFVEPQIMDELKISTVNKESMVSPFIISLKIQIINISEVEDKPTEKMKFYSIMGDNQKSIVGPIVGDCMDMKVAPGWGMHGLSKVANG